MWLSRPTEIDLESQIKPESYPNPDITLEVCTSLSFLLLRVKRSWYYKEEISNCKIG